MSLINKIRDRIALFSVSQNGGIAIMFAILIPLMLAMMALYFDSTQIVGKRARLADAMNEGILAIAYRGDQDETRNVALLTEYLQSYLPEANKFKDVSVKITTDNDCITYTGHAKAEVNTFIQNGMLSSFDKEIDVNYRSDACRNVNKSMKGDFVFVLDMSGSMRGKRLRDLKIILKEMIRKGRTFGKASFGMVPFANGVPVRMPGKNELGGEIAGCSVMFVPKAGYDIDYGYWSSIRTGRYKSESKNAYWADKYRYDYYKNMVAVSTSSANLKAMRDEYCITDSGSESRGNYKYSCMSNLNDDPDITTPLSLVFQDSDNYKAKSRSRTLHPSFAQARLANDIKTEANKAANRNIAHDGSIDYEQTIERLFIPYDQPNNAIMTFYQPWTSLNSNYRTFVKMCRMIKGKRKTFANAKVHTKLMELSANLEDVDEDDDDDDDDDDWDDEEEDGNVEDEMDDEDIDDLTAGGLTDTMSGFMRAVPVLARGQSENKAIIIIADGGDNSNIVMRNRLMDEYKLCEKIRDPENYKTYAPKTERVEAYLILLAARGSHRAHVERWSTCVGGENIYYAPDSDDLEEILMEIMTKYGDEIVTFN